MNKSRYAYASNLSMPCLAESERMWLLRLYSFSQRQLKTQSSLSLIFEQ